MKRWGAAIAAIAALAALVSAVFVGDFGSGQSRPADGAPASPAAQRDAADARHGAHRTSGPHRQPVTLRLPAAPAAGPLPLRLTTAMLEQAWQDGALAISAADGTSYRVAIEDRRPEPGGRWTLTGRVQTRLGAQAMVMTFGPDAIFGVLPHPDGSLLQVSTSAGKTRIAPAGGILPPGETASTAPLDYLMPDVHAGATTPARGVPHLPDPRPSKAAAPIDITVLGLYTPELVTLRGSVAAAETEYINLLALANQAHHDSGSRVRLHLAGLQLIEIDRLLGNHEALYAITDNAVEGIDLHELRDVLAADLVALLRQHRSSYGNCGVAWLNGGGRSPGGISDELGFSVSNVEPCGPHVLAHEIGHNLGSTHERAVQGNPEGGIDYGVYEYSFGYAVLDPPIATVMAWGLGGRIGVFSSPSLHNCGGPCGFANEADNVRSLNNAAPATAAFRGPPGVLSILDAVAYEPGTGATAPLVLRVQLPEPAGPGGVAFEVVMAGGTATAGTDYLPLSSTRFFIPEGEREARITFQVNGDETVEPDETIHIRLAAVTGAGIDRRVAVGTILNDDPRPKLSGRLRFDSTVPAPRSSVRITARGAGGGDDVTTIDAAPPGFAYELAVVPGASPNISVDAPAPFAILPFTVGEIRTPRKHDISLRRGVRVSGRLRLRAGQAAPIAPMQMAARASVGGHELPLPQPLLAPPEFRYSHWVLPGTRLHMEVSPPAPYKRFFAIHPDVRSDLVQDIELSTEPALVLRGDTWIKEGPAGTRGALDFSVELSSPAPVGGVRLRYRTVDGSATAGSDYTPLDGLLEIAQGQTTARVGRMEWIGDDRTEGNESFQVLVSDVTGAHPVVSSLKVTLWEVERQTSTPLPSRRR